MLNRYLRSIRESGCVVFSFWENEVSCHWFWFQQTCSPVFERLQPNYLSDPTAHPPPSQQTGCPCCNSRVKIKPTFQNFILETLAGLSTSRNTDVQVCVLEMYCVMQNSRTCTCALNLRGTGHWWKNIWCSSTAWNLTIFERRFFSAFEIASCLANSKFPWKYRTGVATKHKLWSRQQAGKKNTSVSPGIMLFNCKQAGCTWNFFVFLQFADFHWLFIQTFLWREYGKKQGVANNEHMVSSLRGIECGRPCIARPASFDNICKVDTPSNTMGNMLNLSILFQISHLLQAASLDIHDIMCLSCMSVGRLQLQHCVPAQLSALLSKNCTFSVQGQISMFASKNSNTILAYRWNAILAIDESIS